MKKRLQHPENAALRGNTPALLRRLSHAGGGVMLLLLGQLSRRGDNCPSAVGAPVSERRNIPSMNVELRLTAALLHIFWC